MREGRWRGTLWISTDQPRRWQTREISLVEWVAERTWNAVERLRVDAELRLSEERYRSLTQILASVVWHTDPAGLFTADQPEWEAFTGQTWEEYRGEGWLNALHPDDRETVRELWRRALAERSGFQSAGRVWHAPTGGYRYCVGRALPLLDAGGTIREWIGTITDVDEQKRGEEALRESDRARIFLARSLTVAPLLNSGYGWVKRLAAPGMRRRPPGHRSTSSPRESCRHRLAIADRRRKRSRSTPCDLTGWSGRRSGWCGIRCKQSRFVSITPLRPVVLADA